MPKIAATLQVEYSSIFCWIDAQVDQQASTQAVRNRVTEIQESILPAQWNYVKMNENPADHTFRGLTPKQVVQNQLWWKGPPWLAKPPYEWPTDREPPGELPELKIRKLTLLELPVWTKYSSMKKLTRVLAYCYRLIDYKKRKKIKKALPLALSSDEIKRAKFKVIQHTQHAAWSEDIK